MNNPQIIQVDLDPAQISGSVFCLAVKRFGDILLSLLSCVVWLFPWQ